MANNQHHKKASNFYEQAMYFLEAAALVTKECKANSQKNPRAYNNFEYVIVGTHHAFAAELLMKGIMELKTDTHSSGHDLTKLINHEMCADIRAILESKFNDSCHNSPNSPSFHNLLKIHSQHFEKIRYTCETDQPSYLDMTFTSFLGQELKEYLKEKLNI